MSEQLTLFVQPANTVASVSTNFDARVWRALTREQNREQAIAEIRADREMLAQCEAHLPALEVACEPAGFDVVEAAIEYLAGTYGVPSDDEDALAMRKAAIHDALEEMPREAIRQGIRDYNKLPTSKFFPYPGPLAALCEIHARSLRTALTRARRAVSQGLSGRGVVRGVKKEDRAAISEELRALVASIGVSRSVLAQMPVETAMDRAARMARLRHAATHPHRSESVMEADFV